MTGLIIGIIISIAIAVTFLCLYIAAVQDNASLNKDNEWLRKQREEARADLCQTPAERDDDRILDKDTVMEAIRANGFAPEAVDDFVSFKSDDQYYSVRIDKLPVCWVTKWYDLDKKEFDMELMHKAASKLSDEIRGKVLFTEDEDSIIFMVDCYEKKYGHFRDSLTHYMKVLDEADSYFGHLINKRDSTTSEMPVSLPDYAQKWEA